MKGVVILCLGLVVLLTIAASGCLFSPDPKTREVPPLPVAPFPDTPDQLMANFKTAYTGLAIADYRSVLHPDYVFIFRLQDGLPGASDRFTCAEELAAAEKMFSGLPIERPWDMTLPAISSIQFTTLNRAGPWTEVGLEDPDFPNTKRALYEIQLAFSRAVANTIILNGQQEFFVANRDTVVSGVAKQYWQLRGQRDLSGESKGVDGDSWGAVKRLYSN
jgi:hypothetical protein